MGKNAEIPVQNRYWYQPIPTEYKRFDVWYHIFKKIRHLVPPIPIYILLCLTPNRSIHHFNSVLGTLISPQKYSVLFGSVSEWHHTHRYFNSMKSSCSNQFCQIHPISQLKLTRLYGYAGHNYLSLRRALINSSLWGSRRTSWI